MPATSSPASDDFRDAVVRLSFETMAVLGRVGARHDLSLTQLRMLGVMRGREPRMAELADFLGLDRSTVSGLIDRASRRGLVRRTVPGGRSDAGPTGRSDARSAGRADAGPAGRSDAAAAGRADGRFVHVTLTAEGERLGRVIADEVSESIAPLADRLTLDERRRIVVLAGRMLGDGPSISV